MQPFYFWLQLNGISKVPQIPTTQSAFAIRSIMGMHRHSPEDYLSLLRVAGAWPGDSVMTLGVTQHERLCRHEDAYAASKKLLRMTGVKLRQHQLDRPLTFHLGTY